MVEEIQKIAYSEPKSEAGKPSESSVRLGQVFTPDRISSVMVSDLLSIGALKEGTTLLDPCIGNAALPKAVLREGCRGIKLIAHEVDLSLAKKADFWINENFADSPQVIRGDYLLAEKNQIGFDAAIANPPYIRQEWIEKKDVYQKKAKEDWQLRIPGTSNLYVYFIVKLVLSLRLGGSFSVVVYDSWSNTRYGKWLVDFLNSECDSLSSTPVEGTAFEGRLINASVISGRRCSGQKNGKCLEYPSRGLFNEIEGFVPVSKEYWTKRGLRLKQASFFMGDSSDIKNFGATRFAKKPAKVNGLSVLQNHPESAFLISIDDEDFDPRIEAELNARLKAAQNEKDSNKSVLNWYRTRPDFWNRHPEAPKAPLLFNYYFRKRPRHLLNLELIRYADNYYGIVPSNDMPVEACFALFNSTAVALEFTSRSRKQGNNLNKLQLYEYREALVPSRDVFSQATLNELVLLGRKLVIDGDTDSSVVRTIDAVLFRAFDSCEILDPELLRADAKLAWSSE